MHGLLDEQQQQQQQQQTTGKLTTRSPHASSAPSAEYAIAVTCTRVGARGRGAAHLSLPLPFLLRRFPVGGAAAVNAAPELSTTLLLLLLLPPLLVVVAVPAVPAAMLLATEEPAW